MLHIKFKLNDQGEMPLRKKLKVTLGQEPEKRNESLKDFDANGRENVVGMCYRNHYALQQSILTDVKFEVGTEAAAFSAHRLFLALSSPVFEAMFYGTFAEKGECIVIPDVMPDGFKLLLEYIYTETVHFGNETQAFQAFFAAEKYYVPHLKHECELYLLNCTLTCINVWQVLENSIFFNIAALTKRCIFYLRKNIFSVIETDAFLSTGEDTLKYFLKLDGLDISEITLSKYVVEWGEAQVCNQLCESLQEALTPLLGYIRFGRFSQSDFCSFLDLAPGVISDEDSLVIMKHLTKPLTYSLPAWCNLQNWRTGAPHDHIEESPRKKISVQRIQGIKSPATTKSCKVLRHPHQRFVLPFLSNDTDDSSSSSSSCSSDTSSSSSSSST